SVKPQQIDAVAIVRPIPDADFHLKLRAQFPNSRVLVLEHHLAHAASAYYPSPFEEATVLTLDRGGDFRCGSRWQARGTQLTLAWGLKMASRFRMPNERRWRPESNRPSRPLPSAWPVPDEISAWRADWD